MNRSRVPLTIALLQYPLSIAWYMLMKRHGAGGDYSILWRLWLVHGLSASIYPVCLLMVRKRLTMALFHSGFFKVLNFLVIIGSFCGYIALIQWNQDSADLWSRMVAITGVLLGGLFLPINMRIYGRRKMIVVLEGVMTSIAPIFTGILAGILWIDGVVEAFGTLL